MCRAAIALTAKAMNDVDNAEVLLKIKGVIALFIQTMEVGALTPPWPWSLKYLLTWFQGWGYSVVALDNFLLQLFEKYVELLRRRFSDDFQEVCFAFQFKGCRPVGDSDPWYLYRLYRRTTTFR